MAIVSVLMPARNESGRIQIAIQSVLSQTLDDWELIVVDDGSSDETGAQAEAFSDSRIRVVRCEGVGLPRALNLGLEFCGAPLTARLDADDEALPERLERQVQFMRQRVGISLLGSAALIVSQDEDEERVYSPPSEHKALLAALYRDNPFVHSSVIFPTTLVRRLGGYSERFPIDCDYELWIRLSREGTLANVPDPLVKYHVRSTGISHERSLHRAYRDRFRVQVSSIKSVWGPRPEALNGLLRSAVRCALACRWRAEA
jgi:glycosyltransferase involved in cell wall biosynthesis